MMCATIHLLTAREIMEVLQELRPLPYGLTRTRGIIAGSW